MGEGGGGRRGKRVDQSRASTAGLCWLYSGQPSVVCDRPLMLQGVFPSQATPSYARAGISFLLRGPPAVVRRGCLQQRQRNILLLYTCMCSCLRQVPPPCQPRAFGRDSSNDDGDDDGDGDDDKDCDGDDDDEEGEEEEQGCHLRCFSF